MEKIPPLEIKITNHIPDGAPEGSNKVYLQMKLGEEQFLWEQPDQTKSLKRRYIDAISTAATESISKINSL